MDCSKCIPSACTCFLACSRIRFQPNSCHRGAKLREKSSDEKQRDSFTQQVGIGRGVDGKIALNMPRIERQPPGKIVLKALRRGWTGRKKITDPDPGQAAKCHLQTARPVDAHGVGIFLMPVPPLVEEFSQKALLRRKVIGFGEYHEVLVAVQFPNNLVVAYFLKLKVANFVPGLAWRSLPIHRVQMPINGLAEVQPLETQEVELVTTDAVGLLDGLFHLVGKSLTHHVQN